jgi:hypothetical protein
MGIKVEQIVAKGKGGDCGKELEPAFEPFKPAADERNRTGTKRFKLAVPRFKSIKYLISLVILIRMLALCL